MTLASLASQTRPWLPRLLTAAAVLGASAYVTRRKTRQAQAENPPQGRFIDVGHGVRLHYTAHGRPDAPPLVLLHGNGASAVEMELSGLVEQAAQHFHVLVFDRPGYGHSTRPADQDYTPSAQARLLLQALRTLQVERPLVLGHSWGTLVARAMALEAPESLRALVLVAGYYTPSLRLDAPLMGVAALPLIGPLLRHTVSPLLSRLIWPLMTRRIFGPQPVTAAFKERYPVWMSLRPGTLQASAAESAMLIPEGFKQWRREQALHVPTVIVAGEKDLLVMTPWQARRLHRRLPQTRLHVIPGEGHMVHHTATPAVMAAIDEAHQWSMTPVQKTLQPSLPLPMPVREDHARLGRAA